MGKFRAGFGWAKGTGRVWPGMYIDIGANLDEKEKDV